MIGVLSKLQKSKPFNTVIILSCIALGSFSFWWWKPFLTLPTILMFVVSALFLYGQKSDRH